MRKTLQQFDFADDGGRSGEFHVLSVTSTRKVPPRTVMVQWSMPVLARNVMAVAHRPCRTTGFAAAAFR